MKSYNNFTYAYKELMYDLKEHGIENTVRNMRVKELLNYSFTITNPRDRLLNIPERNTIMRRYIFGELLWYLSGSDKLSSIVKYSKFWKNISDDGYHSNSAYGKYIFGSMERKGDGVNYKLEHPGYFNQWDWCKKLLTDDCNTREAVINIKPIQMYETKDVVCTIALNFYIRDNKLHLTTYMRSNDAVKGLTYDVFMFTFLQELMAKELNVELGTYNHVVTNLHIYERDWQLIDTVINNRDNSVLLLAPIEEDFRKVELPLLLRYEAFGFTGIELTEIEKLSTLSWQLMSFLEDSNYVREKIQERL